MASAIQTVLREVEAKAKAWEDDVAKMRDMTPVNPPADTLEFAAKELRQLVHLLRAKAKRLTPEQYARLQGVSVQTVRRWCARKELEARQNADGEWEIDAEAVRAPRTRSTRQKRPA